MVRAVLTSRSTGLGFDRAGVGLAFYIPSAFVSAVFMVQGIFNFLLYSSFTVW